MRNRRFEETPLFMALLMWVCTLPFLALIAPRFIGWEATWYLIGVALVAELLVCWVMCRLPSADKDVGGAKAHGRKPW